MDNPSQYLPTLQSVSLYLHLIHFYRIRPRKKKMENLHCPFDGRAQFLLFVVLFNKRFTGWGWRGQGGDAASSVTGGRTARSPREAEHF